MGERVKGDEMSEKKNRFLGFIERWNNLVWHGTLMANEVFKNISL